MIQILYIYNVPVIVTNHYFRFYEVLKVCFINMLVSANVKSPVIGNVTVF